VQERNRKEVEGAAAADGKKKKKKKKSAEGEKPRELVDEGSVKRISELTIQLNKEVIAILKPLKLKKVSLEDIQSIFDVITKEAFILACFQDERIAKVVVILADFLEESKSWNGAIWLWLYKKTT